MFSCISKSGILVFLVSGISCLYRWFKEIFWILPGQLYVLGGYIWHPSGIDHVSVFCMSYSF